MIAAIALVVAAAMVTAGYRTHYGTWPWSTFPDQLRVCGRQFNPQGPGTTKTQLTSEGYHLVRHGSTPAWFHRHELWTFDTVNRQVTTALPGGCHVVMWIQDRSNYRPYVLSGSP